MRLGKSWIAMAGALLLAAGCATTRNEVSVEASAEQPQADIRRDEARCSDAPSVTTPTVQAVRNREYAACLLADGHRVSMPVRAGVEHARVSVATASGRPAPDVSADLAACEATASAGRVGTTDVVAGQSGVLRQGDALQVRPHTADSVDLAKQFVACLRQRGYDAK